MKKITACFLKILMVFNLFFCKSSSSSITSQAQNLISVQAVEPELKASSTSTETKNILSFINIPVRLSMSDIQYQLNTQLPTLIYEDNSLEDNNQDNFMCKISKRSNIQVSTQNNQFLFTIPLKIWVKAGFKVSPLGFEISHFKDTEFDMTLRLSSTFDLNQHWEIISKTKIIDYTFDSKPTLSYAGINIPISLLISRVLDAKKGTIAQSIDESIRTKMVFKDQLLEIWNRAKKPVLVSEKYHTWLKIDPLEMQLSDLSIDNQGVEFTIGMQAFTRTFTKKETPTVELATRIPPLVKKNNPDKNFIVPIISQISYEEAAELSLDTLKRQIFEFNGGKQKIRITNLSLYPENSYLVAKTSVEGSIKGTIYVKGVPIFDSEKKQIYLGNMDFDFSTKNVLLKTASWLLHGTLVNRMKKSLTFDVGDLLTATENDIENNLVSSIKQVKGIKISSQTPKLTINTITLSSSSILVLSTMSGNLQLSVDGFR